MLPPLLLGGLCPCLCPCAGACPSPCPCALPPLSWSARGPLRPHPAPRLQALLPPPSRGNLRLGCLGPLAGLTRWWWLLTRELSCVPSVWHPSACLSLPQSLPALCPRPTQTPRTCLWLLLQLCRQRSSSSPLSWLCWSSRWPISLHLLFPLPATSALFCPLVLHMLHPCHVSMGGYWWVLPGS